MRREDPGPRHVERRGLDCCRDVLRPFIQPSTTVRHANPYTTSPLSGFRRCWYVSAAEDPRSHPTNHLRGKALHCRIVFRGTTIPLSLLPRRLPAHITARPQPTLVSDSRALHSTARRPPRQRSPLNPRPAKAHRHHCHVAHGQGKLRRRRQCRRSGSRQRAQRRQPHPRRLAGEQLHRALSRRRRRRRRRLCCRTLAVDSTLHMPQLSPHTPARRAAWRRRSARSSSCVAPAKSWALAACVAPPAPAAPALFHRPHSSLLFSIVSPLAV